MAFSDCLEFIFDPKYNRRSIDASDSGINIYGYNDYLGINILYSSSVYLDFRYMYTGRICISLFLSQLPRNLQWRINKISDFRENIFIGPPTTQLRRAGSTIFAIFPAANPNRSLHHLTIEWKSGCSRERCTHTRATR